LIHNKEQQKQTEDMGMKLLDGAEEQLHWVGTREQRM
jgi:hypothetical protein